MPRAAANDALESEKAGYEKRAEESKAAGVLEKRAPRGGDPPPTGGSWEWTLNWDPIVYDENDAVAIAEPTREQLDDAKLIIGSCPRSPADVDRLIDEGGVEAIICLQCTLCHGALKIDWDPIRARALDRGVPIVRVSVRDFDRLDQAKMLPEMVRKLACFRAMGKRTYVHCTAGINRASLTVLGYLTFVKGMEYEAALRIVRENRPQARNGDGSGGSTVVVLCDNQFVSRIGFERVNSYFVNSFHGVDPTRGVFLFTFFFFFLAEYVEDGVGGEMTENPHRGRTRMPSAGRLRASGCWRGGRRTCTCTRRLTW